MKTALAPASPNYQRAANRFNLCPMDRTVATAVETVGNAIGEDEEFIRPKRPATAPNRKPMTITIFRRWQSRDLPAVDDKPIAGGVNMIAWARDNRFKDVPFLSAVAGTNAHVIPRRRRDTEVNDRAHARGLRRAYVKPGLNARGRVDHDLAIGRGGGHSHCGQHDEADLPFSAKLWAFHMNSSSGLAQAPAAMAAAEA
jgi:hypothetical protein